MLKDSPADLPAYPTGALLFAGGSNFVGKRPWDGGTKLYYDTVYLLPSAKSYWRAVGKLPRAEGYGVSGTFGDKFILAGGSELAKTFDEVFALSWDGHLLHQRQLPPLPRHRAFAGGTVAGHTLYVACGIEAGQFVAVEAMRDAWALDLADPSAAWQSLDPIPGPGRAYPIAGAVGENFYIFGGVAYHADSEGKPVRTYLKDAYVYAPKRGWTRLADLPHAEAAAPSPAPVTADGRLLVLTGDDGTRTKLDGPNHPGFPENVMLYDPEMDKWNILSEIPISRSTAPTALWEGLWVIINGERKPGYRTPEVWGLRLSEP